MNTDWGRFFAGDENFGELDTIRSKSSDVFCLFGFVCLRFHSWLLQPSRSWFGFHEQD